MDRRTAHELKRRLATLIGEIMEDHVGLALAPPAEGDWPDQLRRGGEDIVRLADALSTIMRYAEANLETVL